MTDIKRVNNLWEKFCNIETAERAIRLGTRNKKRNYSVMRKLCYKSKDETLKRTLDPDKVHAYAVRLIEELESGYKPSPTLERTIHPPRGKERVINSPCLKDHIIQWMAILATKDVLMRGMYDHSYGSLPKRGIEGVRAAVERWVRKDKDAKYSVKLDIKKFYPSVDQEILKSKFRRVIKDKRMLEVLDGIANCIPSGLPIGTYSSQWFANFYLQSLDHFITQDLYKLRRSKRLNFVKHYVRYMDDLLLIGTSKSDLEKAVRKIIVYCETELHVRIKPCWEIKEIAIYARDKNGRRIIKPHAAPIDIVGYRFYKNFVEVRTDIYLHTRRMFAKTIKEIKQYGGITPQHAQGLISSIGWFMHASCWRCVRDMCNELSLAFLKKVVSYVKANNIRNGAMKIPCVKSGYITVAA